MNKIVDGRARHWPTPSLEVVAQVGRFSPTFRDRPRRLMSDCRTHANVWYWRLSDIAMDRQRILVASGTEGPHFEPAA
ncbi:MAG: hypothetical protein ACREEY_13810 [Brevundimonas sp.]